jgi:hypothetical protein
MHSRPSPAASASSTPGGQKTGLTSSPAAAPAAVKLAGATLPFAGFGLRSLVLTALALVCLGFGLRRIGRTTVTDVLGRSSKRR